MNILLSDMSHHSLLEMFYIKPKYFRLNWILLLAVSLWSYEQSKLVRLQLVLFLVIMASFIVFQVF